MKFLSIIGFIFLCLKVVVCQPVYSEDGKLFADREDFINKCYSASKGEKVNINGIFFDSFKFCSCVVDNLIPKLKFDEIQETLEIGDIGFILLNDENFEIIQKCVGDNGRIEDDYMFDEFNDTESIKQEKIKLCVENIMNTTQYQDIWTKELAEDYCDCILTKFILEDDYSYKRISELEYDDKLFNEVVLPCLSVVFKNQSIFGYSNIYNPTDITGNYTSSKVSLIDYLGFGYKIKISIDGVEHYYLFDTGASSFTINRDVERELLLNGSLKKEDYLEIGYYITANNEKIKGQNINLKNVKIGDYMIDNVSATILDRGALLCGKSLFDKFKKWEIDTENKILILYR